MKKLLFLGVSTDTQDALAYAKSKGIYTIVTDYNSPEKSIEKQYADDFWCIDLVDLDILERKCRDEQINGIYAGNNEFCLDQTKELARRLNLPFYASEEGWKAARDKVLFKQYCISAGLHVPKRYSLEKDFQPKVLKEIMYPVMIKPVDSCAAQGVSVCKNEEELRIGYKNALDRSNSGKVIVEDYITGQEITACYYISNGIAQLIYMNKVFPTVINGKKYFFGVTTNRHEEYEDYKKKTSDAVQRLFSKLKCKNGCVFLQMIKSEDQYYFFEMGYRMDGLGGWIIAKEIYGIDLIAKLVELALGENSSEKSIEDIKDNKKTGLIYLLGAKTGRVSKIKGIEEVKKMEGVRVVLERCKLDEMQINEDSMYQAVYYITIISTDSLTAAKKLQKINESLYMYDENNNDMLIRFTDYKRLAADWSMN